MEDISRLFTEILAEFNTEVLEYFRLTNSYLKDLIVYKNIELNTKIQTESEGLKNNTFEKILKAVKTGLNTLGIPIKKLNEHQNTFVLLANAKSSEFTSYTSFVDLYQRNHINELLFEILLEYLLDIDKKKIENFKLFDLLPENFIEKLSKFKENNLELLKIKKALVGQNLKSYIDFSTLTIKKIISSKPTNITKDLKKRKEPEQDILLLLQKAKRDNIEKLKKLKKDIRPSTKLPDIIKEEITIKTVNQDIKTEQDSLSSAPIKQKKKKSFLDFFGNIPPIHPEIVNKFVIDVVSFLNSRVKNVDFFDLEILFYYVSNLKMLNIDIPFSSIEVLEIMKNFINGKVFSASKNNIPDIKSVFYGLSIFSELELNGKTDIIDSGEIEKFIKLIVKYSLPEKLQSNLYSLLCSDLISSESLNKEDKMRYINPITRLDLLNIKEFRTIKDIYNHLALLTLLNNENHDALKKSYLIEIKKLLLANGSIKDSFTDSAKVLLILDLLDLKEQEADICSNLLNFIMNSTKFFSLTMLNEELNWRNSQLGYKIELKMLFWALLASSRYAPQKF